MSLSRNLAYMLAQYKRGTESYTLEKFQQAAKASFQHHWNDHQFCGSWCQAKDWTEEEKEKETSSETRREMERSTDNSLRHRRNLQHWTKCKEFSRGSMNKAEQIHSLVINVFLPKGFNYCPTTYMVEQECIWQLALIHLDDTSTTSNFTLTLAWI
jgi:hypothetical protein